MATTPTFGAAGTVSLVNATSVAPGYPAGLVAGDLLVLHLASTDITNDITTDLVGAGWTEAFDDQRNSGSGFEVRQWVYWKYATGSESGSLTVAWAVSGNRDARMFSIKDPHPSDPWATGTGTDLVQGTNDPITGPSLTPPSANCLGVAFMATGDNQQLETTLAGASGGTWAGQYSHVNGNGNDSSIVLNTVDLSGGGAISGGSFTPNMVTASDWLCRGVVIKPADDAGGDILSPPGIASTTAFGSPTQQLFLVAAGLASTTVLGSPTQRLILAPAGLADTTVLGSPAQMLILAPAGLASTTAFGSPAQRLFLVATGLADTTVLGLPTVGEPSIEPIILVPTGIASAVAFGAPSQKLLLAAPAIASATAFGAPGQKLLLAAPAIASATAFGAPRQVTLLVPTGIADADAFGGPQQKLILSPSGIADADAFGNPAILLALWVLGAAGIPSTTTFGVPTILHARRVFERIFTVGRRGKLIGMRRGTIRFVP
jgi:hypothetical protein